MINAQIVVGPRYNSYHNNLVSRFITNQKLTNVPPENLAALDIKLARKISTRPKRYYKGLYETLPL